MSSQKRIKILVCAYSCVSESGVKQVGGEAELGFQLVKQLSRFFDVYVLTHKNNKEAIESHLKKNPIINIKFFYIGLPNLLSILEKNHKAGIQFYSYLWQIKAYFVARKLHKQYNFNAFHHVTYANDWMASYIGALLPVPYIRGPGGGAHKIPKAFLTDYSFKEKFLEKLRSFGQWIFRHDPFFIIGHNRAKAILVCNQESFNALPKKWQKKAEFFPVVGVSKEDIIKDSRLRQGFGGQAGFKIISAGKLLKLKRFDLAIRAFKIFNGSFPNSQLTIIGEGPEFKNLNSLVGDFGLQKSVIFKNWMARENLLSEIAESDVFVFPSLRDGGGAVVVEAMAQGKPIVCFDIAGPGVHVKNEWGIKIKPENPNQAIRDMANALQMLHQDKNLREKLGMAAKKRAEEFYEWDKLGDRLYRIYQSQVLKLNN